ncbi:hypothetical protein GRI69_15590 [Erythrobacter vulgaris]|uniref:Peptidase M10 serralysin C-terminal domain-containing protein n=1 Tax=Qipengyuania vulgaris TaxID=291985 RepID=A0A844XXM5_9SPHN|nr:M10 family metallopeptidase C-terminal domain-containing protein [Qipengyuania vulgaris]MXO49672.1 hypothetical protein [Qipengyuania vulgaris]
MTIRIGSVSESNHAPTSSVSGNLASGSRAGMTVLGVAFAGQQTGNVGTQFEGTFGTLVVGENGTFEYILDNTDTDTDLLSSGETSLDRFVVTYRLGGQTYTMDVEIAIGGVDEPGQTWTEYGGIVPIYTDTVIGRDTFVRFESPQGYSDRAYFSADVVDFTNYGSISFTSNGRMLQAYALAAPVGQVTNFGRITATSDENEIGDILPIIGYGYNHGVLSALHRAPADPSMPDGRAIGGDGILVNTGLIEAVSNFDAYGVWRHAEGGSFENTGFIYVEGGSAYTGSTSDPLGIIGFRSGAINDVVNDGTVHVISNASAIESVGFYFFANSTNIYNQMTFENNGTIVADRAIFLGGRYEASIEVMNSGHIEGALELVSGVNVITNASDAYWRGDFLLGPNTDLLRNAGLIVGNVQMGSGADRYDGQGSGRVIGNVLGGEGNDFLSGGHARDYLYGQIGNDVLVGNGGADTLYGGAGSDVFVYRSASDSTGVSRDTIADFESGIDRIDISALNAESFTLTQSGNSTILRAQTSSGVLDVSVSGSVVASDIVSSAPASRLEGSYGSDNLFSLGGDTTLRGVAGDDALFGAAGNDTLDGGAGIDHMFGGAGNDVYYISDYGDLVVETDGGGIDEVRSSVGFILPNYVERGVLLGSSNISIRGNDLDNTLIGNAGNNVLTGETGSNMLIGGFGADWFELQRGFNRVVYNSVQESTVYGADVLQTDNSGEYQGDYVIDLTALAVQEFAITGERQLANFGGASVFYRTYTEITITADTGELVLLIDGEINLAAFDWNRSDGLGGVLKGSAAGDRLVGGDDKDFLYGNGGADYVFGRLGADTLDGGGGNDTLDGGQGADALFGGAGWDNLTGGEGDDILDGGYGDDRLDGGRGVDTASFASSSNAISLSLALGAVAQNTGNGSDTLISIENVTGSDFADTLAGDGGRNTLSGLAGNDMLEGAGGDDTLDGGGGRDALHGGAGWDTLDGGAGNDLLDGGNGSDRASYLSAWSGVTVSIALEGAQNTLGSGWDTLVSIEYLTGSAFGDTLTGSDGDNQIFGDAGSDTIFGGFGNDLLLGQDGDDVIEGQAGWDTLRGDDGNDTLIGGNGGDMLLGKDGIDTLSGNSGFDRIYGGSGDDIISGGADRDLLFGEAGDDTISGDGGNDLLQGHNGDDTLDGGDGNDTINGGAGNDALLGGNGDDILIGNWGIDTMTGGGGADTFLFKAGHTGSYENIADTILDFSQAEGDIIDLSQIDAIAGGGDDAFAFIGDAAFSGTAGELRFTTTENGLIVEGDTDGDGVADLFIAVDGLADLTMGDFML